MNKTNSAHVSDSIPIILVFIMVHKWMHKTVLVLEGQISISMISEGSCDTEDWSNASQQLITS